MAEEKTVVQQQTTNDVQTASESGGGIPLAYLALFAITGRICKIIQYNSARYAEQNGK